MTEPEGQHGVGEPDPFQRLWTPHRMAYIKRDQAEDHCVFCHVPSMDDDDGLVVARGETVYVVLNLYPYNPGHLMLVPFRHIADLTELTEPEASEMHGLTKAAMTALRAVSAPQGFNVGLNLGTVAGAGIAAHLHQHVVPRWGGDTNFMPVVGHTKVLPQLLGETRALLAAAWPPPAPSP